jgi:tRNA nucleotidyltransferase (CCA-adding enzyme)
MNIILTHEQADFDAVGGLLAASILQPDSIPILPNRINRNVQAYLNMYGDHLPFQDFASLRKQKVSNLTLVDTQSLPSVAGHSPQTTIQVIDHHPQDEDLNVDWTVHIEEVGATTTILVEWLQEAGVDFGSVEATLLLLGIYEDTGSLSYAGTTPRDVRASAWLLDHGGNLSLVNDFLNHPFTSGQADLYERLIEASETHTYHGLSVMIACAPAAGLTDEISPIAHKIRDVFDTEGLFVIVGLNGNVQLVARSTTDSVDVSLVAEHFGGGGHSRAAAALIRNRRMEEIREEILTVLPDLIKPTRTVGEIMSSAPQLLQADEPIRNAAEQMNRFGHEGYPVISGGRVIGLLTRRAVDRALGHDMGDHPVSEIMNAGELFVQVDDSVQYLQKVMIEHNWGQVPVIEPKTGDVVGIVTRTDLLKTLSMGEIPADGQRLADRLQEALPQARLELLKLIAQEAEGLGLALFIVGGFVRDMLLDCPSVDFDLVVEGDAIGLAQTLTANWGGEIHCHRRFGTAKWTLDLSGTRLQTRLALPGEKTGELPPSLDFVTARAEFYTHPTALPSVTQGSIKLDLHRRDFSINTLALRLDGRHYGQLLDHWGGGRDLRDGRIRVLHSLSFVDDPTRMLRAVRLEQRLGFEIEPRTLELLKNAAPLLEKISGERIRSELRAIFRERRRNQIMQRLRELGLLVQIDKDLTWNPQIEKRFDGLDNSGIPEDWNLAQKPTVDTLFYSLWFLDSGPEITKELCDRLHFPIHMCRIISETEHLARHLTGWSEDTAPSRWVQTFEQYHTDTLVVIWYAFMDDGVIGAAIQQFFREWRDVKSHVSGEELRSLGLTPGPIYSQILWELRAGWLDGELQTEEQERIRLKNLVETARAS